MTVVVKTDRDGIPGFGPARAGLSGRDRWKRLAIQHHLLDPWRAANYEDQIARSRLVAAGRSRNVDHGSRPPAPPRRSNRCPPKFTESKRAFRRAMEAFRPPPFQRAVRAAPAASRL